MKNIILILISLLFLTGCSRTPCKYRPHGCGVIETVGRKIFEDPYAKYIPRKPPLEVHHYHYGIGGDCFKDKNVDDCRVKAEQGFSKAQFNLGVMYYDGHGVVQDYKEAVKWLTKSAEQGDFDAQSNLGVLYEKGQGVPQDYKEAVKWYRKSSEQGNSSAQYNLGQMYLRGTGVLQDYVMTHMFWDIAAVSGHKNAIKNRGIVEEMMTSSQIAEAQRMAREWMRKHQ
jgi:TPR repeat protein